MDTRQSAGGDRPNCRCSRAFETEPEPHRMHEIRIEAEMSWRERAARHVHLTRARYGPPLRGRCGGWRDLSPDGRTSSSTEHRSCTIMFQCGPHWRNASTSVKNGPNRDLSRFLQSSDGEARLAEPQQERDRNGCGNPVSEATTCVRVDYLMVTMRARVATRACRRGRAHDERVLTRAC